jgi:DNA-binding MarR family transcriptional regulator
MDRPRSTDEYLDMWIIMRRANDMTYKALSEALRKHGCTREHFEVLDACERSARPVTTTELSRWLYREPHTIVGLLNRMERAGLIERKHNDSGPQRNLIVPTQKGHKIHKAANPTAIRVISRITHQFPEDLLPKFILSLRKVRDSALKEVKNSVLKESLARRRH